MNFFKSSTIYLCSNILNALVPFMLLPILTRYLSPDGYGQIAMFQTLVTGLAAVVGLNTVGAANRRFYDSGSYRDLAEYNGACIHILLLSVTMLLGLALLIGERLSSLLQIPNYWFFLAIIVSAGMFIIQLRLGQWQIRNQALSYGFLQVSQSLINFALTLFFLFCVQQVPVSRVNAMLMTTSVFVILCFISLYREKQLIISRFRIDYIKDALKFGVPLIPHILGIFFLSAIDRILITNSLGIGEAGIYMLGVQLSLGMVVVFDAINKALVPWLFKMLAANNIIQLTRLIRFTYIYFIVLFCLGALAFWVGPFVVRLIAGVEYQKATTIIGWLCLGQAFNGMYLMVTNYIFYAKKTGSLSIVTITFGVFNVILLLYMMNKMGIVGVSIAFAISMFLRFLATWCLAVKVSNISWRV